MWIKKVRGLFAIFCSGIFLLMCIDTSSAEAAIKQKKASSYLENAFKAKRIMSVSVSGDCSKVAFAIYFMKDADGRKYWHNQLFVRNSGGRETLAAEGADMISSPLWSFDGKHLAYLTRSAADRQTCIWIYDCEGNTAHKLLTLKQDMMSYKWSPDGGKIAFIAADSEHRIDSSQTQLIDVSRQYVNMRLYSIAVNRQENAEIKALTPGDYSVNCGYGNADFDWSPDGRYIAFAYQPSPDFQHNQLSRIAVVDIETLRISRLHYTDNHTGITPSFSPDGKKLAFATNLAPGNENREAYGEIVHYRRICVSYPAGGAPPVFLSGTPSESPNIIGWEKDGKGVYACDLYRTRGTQIYFLSLDPSTPAEQISHFKGRIEPLSISLNSSRTEFGCSCETVSDAPEVFVSAANPDSLQFRQITRLAEPHQATLGQVEVVRWKSTDGREIEGLLIKPPDYDPKKRYPLYVMLHGAPLAWEEGYLGGCLEFGHQMFDPSTCVSALLDWGFVVFQPNFRGSTSYGKEFQAANVGDWGGGDYQDIISGVDYLTGKGIADEKRMVIGGWSYGGTMTAFAIGQTDRFKAAIVGAGVTDLISMAGTSDIPELLKKNLASYMWDNPDLYWKRSAIAHVKNIRTPVLILHGENDTRVPVSQAHELYQALRLQKKPVTMLLLPKEGHAVSDPGVIIATIEAIHDWLFKTLELITGRQ
ncbi:MAG: prolyl oligopeptidase family serine peptidase [Candidatus Xenobiia bacterium LiM19]